MDTNYKLKEEDILALSLKLTLLLKIKVVFLFQARKCNGYRRKYFSKAVLENDQKRDFVIIVVSRPFL